MLYIVPTKTYMKENKHNLKSRLYCLFLKLIYYISLILYPNIRDGAEEAIIRIASNNNHILFYPHDLLYDYVVL